MIVTEEEAKTKLCQETFAISMKSDSSASRVDHCIGSDCMAWRWNDSLDLIASMVAERGGTRKGYCGKAGAP